MVDARRAGSRPRAPVLLPLAALALAACAPPDPGGEAAPADSARGGLTPAEGARADPLTGLPDRVVHRDSGITLRLIPAGEFPMGSPEGEEGRGRDERRHRRLIRRPFYLGETEVTVAQFRRFVEATAYRTDAERGAPDGEHREGAYAALPEGNRAWSAAAGWRHPFPNLSPGEPPGDRPVVQVSWRDARRFSDHHRLRLPTEAEWEYACRAGSTTRFFWGDSEAGGSGFANVADDSGRARFASWNYSFSFDDGAAVLAAAGSYRANPWGLRDMVGSVAEWCEDAFLPYPTDGADESAAGGDLGSRVLRGGSWLDGPDLCRSAARATLGATHRRDFIGFRVAAEP